MIIFISDETLYTKTWENFQKEMEQMKDADPSQSWIDEFSSYYNTGQKVMLKVSGCYDVFEIVAIFRVIRSLKKIQ